LNAATTRIVADLVLRLGAAAQLRLLRARIGGLVELVSGTPPAARPRRRATTEVAAAVRAESTGVLVSRRTAGVGPRAGRDPRTATTITAIHDKTALERDAARVDVWGHVCPLSPADRMEQRSSRRSRMSFVDRRRAGDARRQRCVVGALAVSAHAQCPSRRTRPPCPTPRR
jgi:hypothetical protein